MAKDVTFSVIAKNKTAKTFAKIRSSVGSLNTTVLGLGASIAGAAGLGGLGVMGKAALDTADKLHKLSARLGTNTEALSQYRHVASQSGVSFETLSMGWQRMTRRVAEAAQGTGEAKGALEELGIAADELNQLAPEKQFEVLADAMGEIENPADRVRLAMKLWDTEGVALLQMIDGGSESLRRMRDEADRLGATMETETVAGMVEAKDAVDRVTTRIKGMVESIVGELAPSLTDIADNIGYWIDQNRDLINQKMGTVFESLKVTAQTLIPVFKFIAEVFQIVGKAIGWVSFQVYRVMDAFNAFEGLAKGWQWIKDSFSMGDGSGAGGAPELTGAAAIAAAGGGAGFTGQDAEDYAFGTNSGGGNTYNFNQQITRSDAVAITTESERLTSRQ